MGRSVDGAGHVSLQRLRRSTIWHPDAIPAAEGELARDMKRWVLPTFDLVLIGAALLALYGGLPTFALVYATPVAIMAAWALLAVALTCLVGISFPRLWLVELIGKCGLILLLVPYGVIALVVAVLAHPNRSFLAGLALSAAILPLWRVVWLGREWRRRRARELLERQEVQ